MARLLLAAIAAAVVMTASAAPASANMIYPPRVTPPSTPVLVCGMCPQDIVRQWVTIGGILVDSAVRSLAADDELPEGTTVKKSAIAAYGTGTTTCSLNASKSGSATGWSFEGTTDCSGAVLQTAQATMTGPSGSVTGTLCSGLRMSCRSAGSRSGAYTDVRYRITVVAPPGQGWIASPQECSGAGTDRLDCTF